MDEQTLKQKIIALCQSEHAAIIPELLKKVRTELFSIVADDEFHTLVNALTLSIEAEMIKRTVVFISDTKEGKLHEQQSGK